MTDRLRIIVKPTCRTASSDVFLNTTRFESFGVSLLEAAASGVPIVSTDVGEIPYLWENERDALLVPSRSASMMIAAVRRLLREPELSRALATNARKKAERFDWSMTLPTWEALLQRTDLRRCSKSA